MRIKVFAYAELCSKQFVGDKCDLYDGITVGDPGYTGGEVQPKISTPKGSFIEALLTSPTHFPHQPPRRVLLTARDFSPSILNMLL